MSNIVARALVEAVAMRSLYQRKGGKQFHYWSRAVRRLNKLKESSE